MSEPDNFVFTKLNAANNIEGMIAYAIYKKSKREWIAKNNPQDEEIAKYHNIITDTHLALYLNDARSKLVRFSQESIRRAADALRKEGAESAIVTTVKSQQSSIKNGLVNVVSSALFALALYLLGLIYLAPTIPQFVNKSANGAKPPVSQQGVNDDAANSH